MTLPVHKSWTVTIHISEESFDHVLKNLEELDKEVLFMVGGLEFKPTLHFQCYMIFHNPVTFFNVKRLLSEGAHIAPARMDKGTNVNYCCKQGFFFFIDNSNKN